MERESELVVYTLVYTSLYIHWYLALGATDGDTEV